MEEGEDMDEGGVRRDVGLIAFMSQGWIRCGLKKPEKPGMSSAIFCQELMDSKGGRAAVRAPCAAKFARHFVTSSCDLGAMPCNL